MAPLFFLLLFGIIEAGRFVYYSRDPQQRDARGCALRDRQRGQRRPHRLPERRHRLQPAVRPSCDYPTGSERRRRGHARPPSVSAGSARRSRRPGARTTVVRLDGERGGLVSPIGSLIPHRPLPPDHRHSGVEPCRQQLTDRAERGQVLVLFAGGLVLMLIVAALGVRRRDDPGRATRQSRTPPTPPPLPAPDTCLRRRVPTGRVDSCRADAGRSRTAFDDRRSRTGRPMTSSTSSGPTCHGAGIAGFPGFIEVQIEIGVTRPSIFAGIVGRRPTGRSGRIAVATNDQDLTLPVRHARAEPDARCKAIAVSGGAIVESHATSSRTRTGLSASTAAPVESADGGARSTSSRRNATVASSGRSRTRVGPTDRVLAKVPRNSFALPDPLRNLAAPAKPGLAAAWSAGRPRAQARSRTMSRARPAPRRRSHPDGVLRRRRPTVRPIGPSWILYPGLYPGGIGSRTARRRT